MKKKKINIPLMGVLILISLVVLNSQGVFDNLKFAATSSPVVDSGETTPEFVCPSGASYCQVRGVMECNYKKEGEDIITFRTNVPSKLEYNKHSDISNYCCKYTVPDIAGNFHCIKTCQTSEGTHYWIAIPYLLNGNNAIKSSELHMYCVTGFTGGSRNNELITPLLYNTRAYVYNSALYIETGNSNDVLRRYEFCDIEETTELRIRESIPNYFDKELTGGNQTIYSCSGNFIIEDKNSDIISTKQLFYSSNTNPDDDKTGWININEKETAKISGGDNNYIEYKVIQSIETCIKDVCENDLGYRKCENSVHTDFVSCDTSKGEKCIDTSSDAICEIPFSKKDIFIVDKNGNKKSGFTSNESVYVKLDIQSNKVSSGNIILKVFKGSEEVHSEDILDVKFNTGKSLLVSIPNPKEIGNYYVKVEISFNSYTIKIGENQEYPFRISVPIFLSMRLPYSEKTGTTLYTNDIVYIDLQATDENGFPTEVSEVVLKLKLNGQESPTPNYVYPLPDEGLYRFKYTFLESGIIESTAKLIKYGVESNEETRTSEVKNPKIITTLTNIGLLRSIKPGVQTITFETKDSYGDYVETNNIVKIIPPGASTGRGDIDISSQVEGSNGIYSVDYNFEQRGGYKISILSSAESYPIGDKPESGSIDVSPVNIPDECQTSLDCSSGKICIDGKCVQKDQPILLYIIFIISAIAIFILIIVIIKLSRKKKGTDVFIGGGL